MAVLRQETAKALNILAKSLLDLYSALAEMKPLTT